MKAGREMDALVAEHVLKVWNPNDPRYTVFGGTRRYVLDHDSIVKCYSTDWGAAMQVRDAIRAMLFSKRHAFTEACRILVSEEMECDEGIHHSEVILRITPEQICQAALVACGISPEKPL